MSYVFPQQVILPYIHSRFLEHMTLVPKMLGVLRGLVTGHTSWGIVLTSLLVETTATPALLGVLDGADVAGTGWGLTKTGELAVPVVILDGVLVGHCPRRHAALTKQAKRLP
jgi:hypothetical protein